MRLISLSRLAHSQTLAGYQESGVSLYNVPVMGTSYHPLYILRNSPIFSFPVSRWERHPETLAQGNSLQRSQSLGKLLDI